MVVVLIVIISFVVTVRRGPVSLEYTVTTDTTNNWWCNGMHVDVYVVWSCAVIIYIPVSSDLSIILLRVVACSYGGRAASIFNPL